MFCDKCGSSLQTGQRFCPSCGKEVVGGAQWAQLRRGLVSAHIRLLGILWLAISAFNTLSGLAILFYWSPNRFCCTCANWDKAHRSSFKVPAATAHTSGNFCALEGTARIRCRLGPSAP